MGKVKFEEREGGNCIDWCCHNSACDQIIISKKTISFEKNLPTLVMHMIDIQLILIGFGTRSTLINLWDKYYEYGAEWIDTKVLAIGGY